MATPSGTSKIPRHVALIMDGNGRWARSRKMLRAMGHREGIESVREIVRVAGEVGVGFITLYAFSVENWQRPAAEVATLMRFLEMFLKGEIPELNKNNVRLRAIGRLSDLPKRVRDQLDRSIEATSQNTGVTLILALSYGARVEIVEAVRALAAEAKSGLVDPARIDEKAISAHLYTHEYPDPDLLIRTSGEMRLSNFLLWQLSYTEIYVTKTLWPDFRRTEFLAALDDYAGRQRRFGKV